MIDYTSILKRYFNLEQEGGDNKVIPLREAVKNLVQPEMIIHIAFPAYYRANAAIREIIKQYWNKQPDFTILCIGMGVQNFAQALIHGGLVKKVVSTFCADAYPTPGPNPVFNRAFAKGEVDFEHWSILTYTARLLAGAMGIGFMPTNSLIGSSMAHDNSSSFSVIDDPFESGVKRGIVKALNPDLTLIHGLAADVHGNTILAPPYIENNFGAFASKKGVLVTVEKLVSTEFIRKYSHLVKLPCNIVRSVSVVPFGAHPLGVSSAGIPEIEVYAEDYDFIKNARIACRNTEDLDEWVKKWVLECPDQEEYIRRLGQKRIMRLKGKTHTDSWQYEIDSRNISSQNNHYNSSEMMVIAVSRILIEKVFENKYSTILPGIGIVNLAAWLAYYRLKERDYPVNLIAEIGMFGYAPRPGDPFIFNHGNVQTSKMLTDSFQALGMMVAGKTNSCIGALGTALVDKEGNLNTTLIAPQTLISGSGGGNDTVSGSREVIASDLTYQEDWLSV